MEVDSIHANIERKSANKVVYLPCDWINIMKEATIQHKYDIVRMFHSDFVDWNFVARKILTNTKWLDNGEILQWSKVKHFRFEKENPGRIFHKYDLDDEAFVTLSTDLEKPMKSGRRGCPVKPCRFANWPDASLANFINHRAYSEQIPIQT